MMKIVDDYDKYASLSKKEKERIKKAIDDFDSHLRKRITEFTESQKSLLVATVFSPSWIDFYYGFKNIDKPVFENECYVTIESEANADGN